MSVRTIYELRTLIKMDGYGDLAHVERFDELEPYDARIGFDRECKKAKQIIGTEQEYKTEGFNVVMGVVRRVCVELLTGKTDGGRIFAQKVLDADGENSGCSYFLTDNSRPAATRESVMAAVGVKSVDDSESCPVAPAHSQLTNEPMGGRT